MFFYFVHHINHYWAPNKSKTDGQRNAATFLFGAIAWWMLFAYLHSEAAPSNLIITALKSWFAWLIAIDAATMAILYRTYYNRSIVNEVFDEKKKEKKGEPGVEEKIIEKEITSSTSGTLNTKQTNSSCAEVVVDFNDHTSNSAL